MDKNAMFRLTTAKYGPLSLPYVQRQLQWPVR